LYFQYVNVDLLQAGSGLFFKNHEMNQRLGFYG
jgi:hypothetical protein